MVLGSVAAHDENDVAGLEIDPMVGDRAA